MTTTLQHTSRSQAMTAPCPSCAAAAGDPCIGARGKQRTACHAERHTAAIAAGAPAWGPKP